MSTLSPLVSRHGRPVGLGTCDLWIVRKSARVVDFVRNISRADSWTRGFWQRRTRVRQGKRKQIDVFGEPSKLLEQNLDVAYVTVTTSYNIHRKLHEAYGMSSQPGAKAGARCDQRVAGRKSPCRPLWLNTWSPSILSVVQCPPVCPVKPAPSLSKWWIDLCLQVPCHNPNPSPNRRLSSS